MAEILFEQIATSGSSHVYTTAVRQFMTGHRLPQDTRFVRTLRHKLGRRPKAAVEKYRTQVVRRQFGESR